MAAAASGVATANRWLVALPLDVGSLAAALAPLRAELSARGGDAVATLLDFNMPPLKVRRCGDGCGCVGWRVG